MANLQSECWRKQTQKVYVPPHIASLSFAPLHTRPLEIPADAQKLADAKNFEVKGYRVGAAPEQSRPPRRVRIALVQNAIVRPTTDPIEEQVCAGLSQSAYLFT